MKKYWQALTVLVLVICLIVMTNLLAHTQQESNPQGKLEGSPVIFNNETLFTIQEKFGLTSPQQRAKEISNRIGDVAKDISISLDSLQIAEVEGVLIVSSEEIVLVGITEADAKAVGKTQRNLAAEYLQKIKASIELAATLVH